MNWEELIISYTIWWWYFYWRMIRELNEILLDGIGNWWQIHKILNWLWSCDETPTKINWLDEIVWAKFKSPWVEQLVIINL